ncbi:MAG: EAL domain-containing protein, partial [Sulfurimonadaceae bacterium]|nr:EAL domain-containing protein [Sulfurimonadaceae bacterium]
MIKQKILLVDDEPSNISVLVEILNLDYTLLVATSGLDALKILNSQNDIDLILLDIVMPHMDGYEVAHEIKNTKKLRDIPFVFLTAKSNPQSILKGFSAGAVDYIAKPFSKDELLARVQTHLKIKKLSVALEKKVIELDGAMKHYKALNLALPVGVIVYKAKNKNISYVNTSAERILQMSKDKLVKNGLQSKKWTPIHEDGSDFEAYSNPALITIETKKPVRDVIIGLKNDDFTTWIDLNSEAIFDKDAELLEVILTITDITKQKNIEKELAREQKRFALAIEGSEDGLWDWNLVTNDAYISDQFQTMLGYDAGELPNLHTAWLNQIHPEDKAKAFKSVEDYLQSNAQGVYESRFRMRKKNGEYIWVLGRGKADISPEGIPLRFVGFNTDITKQVNQEIELEHSAKHDALTGLPNRFLLSELLSHMMDQAHRNDEQIALVFIDLDGFKQINDNYGHEAGDFVLKEISIRIKKVIRANDIVSRIGGDEFVVVLTQTKEHKKLIPLLDRILFEIAKPIVFNNDTLKVSASIGVSFYPQTLDIGAEVLLRQADQAMYGAKINGKNKYHFFDTQANDELHQHQEKLTLIRNAIVNNELILHYQPKVNMQTGEILGFEALVRWQHPELGLLFPDSFLPYIEKNSALMIQLGDWVCNCAFKQLEVWVQSDIKTTLSINVSSHELQQNNYIEKLQILFEKYTKISPSMIELEILETHALEEFSHIYKILQTCKNMGIKIALDDFGTGYSSLHYLKKFPLNIIKIDKSFVMDSLSQSSSLSIVDASLGLSRAFQCSVIAEGVESIEIGEMLIQLGVSVAQGYIIAKPMDQKEVPHWIKSYKNHPKWIATKTLENEDRAILYASVEHRNWFDKIERYFNKSEIELPT